MQEWKKALWLVKYEWKQSRLIYFILIGYTVLFSFILSQLVLDHPLGGGELSTVLDILFLCVFTGFIVGAARIPQFSYQKMAQSYYSVPFLLALFHLPIKQQTIIKYRFLSYLFPLVLSHSCILIFLYFLWPHHLTIVSYLAFLVLWLCFGIIVGSVNVILEVFISNKLHMILIFVGGPIGVFFYFIYSYYVSIQSSWSVITSTFQLATDYPYELIIGSLSVTIFIWFFMQFVTGKKLERTDYM